MEIKHTLGEWICEIQNGVRFGAFDAVSKSDGSATIAIVYGQNDDERRANAKLISAAPELLEALRFFVNSGVSDSSGAYHFAVESAKSAIKKATT